MIYKKIFQDRSKISQDSFGAYKVQNNVIYANRMEFNAVRHCNLSCKSCSHAAPIQKKRFYDPVVLKQDLETLASFWHVSWIDVLGGEPLLHPDLLRILQVTRESGVADSVRIVTNGVLLDAIDDNMLPYIDEVRVSLYPNQSKQNLERIYDGIANLKKRSVPVDVIENAEFREAFAQATTTNKKLINKIYTTCRVAHDWKCVIVDNGMLYRCPQAIVYEEYVGELLENKRGGALRISSIKTYKDILNFLETNKAITPCSFCLGSVGQPFEHTQVKRKEWCSFLPETPEDGFDEDMYLEIKNLFAQFSYNQRHYGRR